MLNNKLKNTVQTYSKLIRRKYNMKIEYRPLTDISTDYLALSLIDRGLATTRALKISEALREGDWDKVTTAICNCDNSNFSLLLEIEPRLIYTAFDLIRCNALKERIEEATDSFYQLGEFHQSVIGDTTF
jgi:hypothetical protein